MDDVRLHHWRKNLDFLFENGVKVLFLPAYQPDYTPVENIFFQF
jgi:transposase